MKRLKEQRQFKDLFLAIKHQKKSKCFQDFFARYYSQDQESYEDAEIESTLIDPESTALQARQRSDKPTKIGSSDYEVSPSCFCNRSKDVSSAKEVIFILPTLLKLLYF